MKHLILVKAFFLYGLAYIFGAIVGLEFGFNPIISGVVSIVGFSIAKRPQGALSDGLDLTAVTAQLGDYFRRYSNSIWSQILKGNDFEQYMKAVPGQTSKYTTTVSRRSEFLQAYQKGFQSKGGVEFIPYDNNVFYIKMDHTQEDLPKLFNTYLSSMALDGVTPDKYPFVKWLMDTHIIPGITEELRAMCIKGKFVPPTPGVAGNSIDSANGVFTIITEEIANNNLEPIVLGAITPANIVDKYELFHRSLPEEYKRIPGPIFVSSSRLEDYKYGYRDEFGQNRDFTGPTVSLWGTNKELVGLDFLNGSDRMLFTPTGPNGNIIKMYDKILMPTPTVQLEKREVHILADFHRSWGFDTLQEVFTNDQE